VKLLPIGVLGTIGGGNVEHLAHILEMSANIVKISDIHLEAGDADFLKRLRLLQGSDEGHNRFAVIHQSTTEPAAGETGGTGYKCSTHSYASNHRFRQASNTIRDQSTWL
jgi:hypothetical protein